MAGTATAEAASTSSAHEAQNTLPALTTPRGRASQVRSLAADIQRSLSIAGTATAEALTSARARRRTR